MLLFYFDQEENLNAKLVYEKPINAPVKANQKVGMIIIDIPNKEKIEIELLAKNEVKKINPLIRIFSAFNYIIFGNVIDE